MNFLGCVLVFIGTYTTTGSQGVYVYRFNPETGELVDTKQRASAANPSFVSPSPDGRFLYAVNEVAELDGRKGGAVSAFRIDPETAALTFLNRQPSSAGRSPCYVSVTPDGKHVAAANYGSGSVVLYPVAADGSLGAPSAVQHQGKGPTKRQLGPHAHSITPDPATGCLIAADLGIDKLLVYRIEDDKLVPAKFAEIKLAPGAGPRHIQLHPNGRDLYVINELDSTISFFHRASTEAEFIHQQTLSTLPAEAREIANTCADLHLHPNGKFLYGSNRGHDSVALFIIDSKTGRLKAEGHFPAGGKNPRNFNIAPGGKFLYTVNQSSDNLVGFRIDPETGALTPTSFSLRIPIPVCIQFSSPGK